MQNKRTTDYQIKQAQLSVRWLTEKLMNSEIFSRDEEKAIIAEALTTISKVLFVDFVQPEKVQATKLGRSRKQVRTAMSNQRWLIEDDVKLLDLHKNGNSTPVMARELGRSVRAIHTRVWLLTHGPKK